MSTRPIPRRALLAATATTGAALALGWRVTAHEGHGDPAATPGATPAATPGTPMATPVAGHGDHADHADHGAATPEGTGVGGAYLTITSAGTAADALLGGHSDVCARVEPHAMRMEGDVMTMTLVPEGIPVGPGETLTLDPGGDAYHLMLVGLTRDLLPGATFDLTLTFREAGDVPVPVTVGWARPEDGATAPVTAGDLTISAAWSRPAPALVG
jgi:periplasmic copper chaperone A